MLLMEEPNPSLLKETTLADCSPGAEFWIHNGPVVSSLKQLAGEIESISEEAFRYHVNSGKNDFAAWISNALQNPFLARDLDCSDNINNKENYVKTIRDHIDWLERLERS